MSTMMTFQNRLDAYLSPEQIRQQCPLAFVETPTNTVSDKYILANTATVIEDMDKLGWKVVRACQRKQQAGASGRFSYHMIAFQNPDIKIVTEGENGEETIESYPRIILTNSHDGLSCFRFMAGLFRLVCSNGLVLATHQMVDLKIRHINYTFEELRAVVNRAVSELPAQVEIINQMKQTPLPPSAQHSLASNMLSIRKGLDLKEAPKHPLETIEELLIPVRPEDEENNLWNVFNRIQEKLINGQFTDQDKQGRPRRARPVSSFIRDLDINADFFRTAMTYIPTVQVAA